jgi:hypothetical protein
MFVFAWHGAAKMAPYATPNTPRNRSDQSYIIDCRPILITITVTIAIRLFRPLPEAA